ncbi:hypothetical protein DFJ63DRAFT_318886 [Scheffersomyces coipomensis]|uniref:uncharacterized protein n=1 Tax=Scheffersomyces coipomensis TaxID=1788519 RepID=UPI00315C6AD6
MKEDYKQLKVDLILKNQIIKNLTDQLSLISKLKTKSLTEVMNTTSSTTNNGIKLAKNHYQLFQDLSRTLQEKTIELEETKSRLEAILVSLTVTNNSNNSSFIKQGQYDEQELSHKIISKIEGLTNENETLLKLISFGNKSSLLIELGLLKRENNSLKEKLQKYENSL